MKYNHAYEKRKFTREQMILQQQYREAGMSEEDIRELYIRDLAYFNLCRREAEHNVPIFETDAAEENTDTKKTDGQPQYEDESTLDWLEEIENKKLYDAIKDMPDNWKEIIELLLAGLNHKEIAAVKGIARQNVTKKIKKIREILINFLGGGAK